MGIGKEGLAVGFYFPFYLYKKKNCCELEFNTYNLMILSTILLFLAAMSISRSDDFTQFVVACIESVESY